VAHSPVRELEVLHDQLLQWFHTSPEPLSPRDVVVMVPDIELMAPAIRAVFGQYKRSDARFIPYDIADLGAQAISPLIHAVEWLLALPQQRSRMSELVELLEVPALAARFGLKGENLPTLTAFLHRYFEIMKDETRHVIQVEERRVSEAMRDQFREDLWEFHPELLEAELLAVRQEPIAQPAAATL
jgi:exonuclease V gamma subunit